MGSTKSLYTCLNLLNEISLTENLSEQYVVKTPLSTDYVGK